MASANDEGRPHGLWQNPVGKGRSKKTNHEKPKKHTQKEKEGLEEGEARW